MHNGKPFTRNFSSLISSRSLSRTDEWSIIAGNTLWYDGWPVCAAENKKVDGTTADLMEDHMLGQHYFDYSWTKIITRLKVTADANLAKKHEDQSKQASQFIHYNFYDVEANVANAYDLQTVKTRPSGLTFGGLRGHNNILSGSRTNFWNSCAAGPVVHNLNYKIYKDEDLFLDTKVDFIHCGNADGIDFAGRPYVLVTFSYFTTTVEVDYIEF